MSDEAKAYIERATSVPTRREIARHVPTRCGITELFVSECGCRLHRGKPKPVDPFASAREVGPWVRAQWDSDCGGCGASVLAGDDIRADSSGDWEGRCCE